MVDPVPEKGRGLDNKVFAALLERIAERIMHHQTAECLDL